MNNLFAHSRILCVEFACFLVSSKWKEVLSRSDWGLYSVEVRIATLLASFCCQCYIFAVDKLLWKSFFVAVANSKIMCKKGQNGSEKCKRRERWENFMLHKKCRLRALYFFCVCGWEGKKINKKISLDTLIHWTFLSRLYSTINS